MVRSRVLLLPILLSDIFAPLSSVYHWCSDMSSPHGCEGAGGWNGAE